MPDRISNFRQIRLSIFPHTDGLTASWSLIATRVRKGVPSANILASGEMLTPQGVSTDAAIWEAVDALVRSEVPGLRP